MSRTVPHFDNVTIKRTKLVGTAYSLPTLSEYFDELLPILFLESENVIVLRDINVDRRSHKSLRAFFSSYNF